MRGQGMSAQERFARDYSAVDTVAFWLDGEHAKASHLELNPVGVLDDVVEVTDRVSRIRSRGGLFERIEVSPYVKGLAKMVGSVEMLLPPSEDN